MKKTLSPIFTLTIVFAVVTAAMVVLYATFFSGSDEVTEEKQYSAYYAMISDNRESMLWQSLYSGAFADAEPRSSYVELMGTNLSTDYSKEELMSIAIASGVDGIILEADDSEELNDLIHEAKMQDIPVVTLCEDAPSGDRCSFVGISNYDLGKEYGRQILKIAEESKADALRIGVLIDSSVNGTTQNIVVSGIQETIDKADPDCVITTDLLSVDDTNSFSAEESVRSMFIRNKETLPDVMVCLNETDTTSVYQAVVDYNMVGELSILGYYDSQAILNGISREVIYSTMTFNTEELGSYCIDALEEYRYLGYTSEYFTGAITVIDRNNVNEYLKGGDEDEA